LTGYYLKWVDVRERREERKIGPRQSDVNIPTEKNEHLTVKGTLKMGRALLSYEIPFSSKIRGQRPRDPDCCHLCFPGAYTEHGPWGYPLLSA